MKIVLIFIFQLQFICCFSQSELQSENVILITLDGLRWQELFGGADGNLINDKSYVKDTTALKQLFWKPTAEARRAALMPFFWNTIAQQGQLYGNRSLGSQVNCTNQHWFSYPGYSEILCGFSDDHRIDSNDKINNPNTTVLEFVNRQQGFNGSVAAFGSWDVFPFIINEERSGIPVNAGFKPADHPRLSEHEKFLNMLQRQIPSPWATVRLDAFTYHYAMEYIDEYHPRLTYIAFGETDDFAHEGHYDAYLKSARQTDEFIAQLWDYVQSNPHCQDKTTLIVTTDHGRGTVPKETWQHHGSKINGADQIWIAVIGPDTPALGEARHHEQLYQNQVAATVANFLGLEYTNQNPVGEFVKSAFK
ncbi:MAG: hypothetical protein DHS20C17_10790 [Cyclobacteriaceae bacterium]|nr:MAG: hypothetical protein DHS20C17_10790 [Cyclobacteriaceae bacterium]